MFIQIESNHNLSYPQLKHKTFNLISQHSKITFLMYEAPNGNYQKKTDVVQTEIVILMRSITAMTFYYHHHKSIQLMMKKIELSHVLLYLFSAHMYREKGKGGWGWRGRSSF